MPIAISVIAAETYYESLGQNWERAAMIKARPVAGDLSAGRRFIADLRPYIWRKHLDFLAIQDIHSIKRQINAHRGGAEIDAAGHNIKLGRGGIREIEFFVQTQQLIWGGREPRLRQPRTIDALHALAAAGHIDQRAADDLENAYRFLRRLEHRLQMVDDQQTHSLPADEAGFAQIATFLGYDGGGALRDALLHQLRTVANHYASLFEEAAPLSGPGNLVFTGGEPEPDTVATLQSMGFTDGGRVFNVVSGWHRGRYAATRGRRSREILTELMPTLLEHLAKTANPDSALARFDEFLRGLPAGVQLFSLLFANPRLLDLLADIMGGAPALAQHLSGNPRLLDAVLSPGFFDRVPDRVSLEGELREILAPARDFQDMLDISRRWTNDRKFQVGVHILRDTGAQEETGRALTDLADTVIRGLYGPVVDELAHRHGRVPGPGMAILGMGKLGSREMTVSSDLDLIFVYKIPEGVEASDGVKPLAPSHYFARLAQRFINALTAPTADGRLYEIDMRLRPSGKSGPIATSLEGFRRYQENEAWTWEHMALTRARVVAGDAAFADRVQLAVRQILRAPRDPDKLVVDVAEMRERIEREHRAETMWDVKYLRGGLVDLEFLAQYLQLRHARRHPEVLAGGTAEVLESLARAGLIGRSLAGFKAFCASPSAAASTSTPRPRD
jgi:glutamate-ammonia-ligase adenylyltransferase